MSGAFYKMTGSGNDFVVLDGRDAEAARWGEANVRALCERRTGVGADGLVLLVPEPGGALRLTYWNADGSRAALCGNAALCAGRLAAELALAPEGEVRLVTDAGPMRVRAHHRDDHAELCLGDLELPEPVAADAGPGERWTSFGTVGVPHLVVRVDAAASVEVGRRGRALRAAPAFGSAGTNVNFVSPPPATPGAWEIRTYERGVEGETLACGTGTVAAALALARRGDAELPVAFRSAGGCELRVSGRLDGGRARDVWLSGQARLVFRGRWEG